MKGCHVRNVSKMKNSSSDYTLFAPQILHIGKLSFSNVLGNMQSFVKFGANRVH